MARRASKFGVLTGSSTLELDSAPEHLIVVVGSYIGLEFAQMYRRFGSDVTVIEMSDRIIGREDHDISDAIQAILEGEGVRFELAAECVGLAKTSMGVAVTASCDDESRTVEGRGRRHGPDARRARELRVQLPRTPAITTTRSM